MKNKITNSWDVNAKEWINLIEKGGIDSRKSTNPAILDIIGKYSPPKILDMGCGEGWLTRALSARGFKAYGADAIRELVQYAKDSGNEEYFQLSYQEIVNGAEILFAPFDAIVFNFSLYEERQTPELLKRLKSSLSRQGLIFIQTLHPFMMMKNGLAYKSRWMDNAWKGLQGSFKAPHDWYYRTLEDWFTVFEVSGFQLRSIREPLATDAKNPVSVIFVLEKIAYDRK